MDKLSVLLKTAWMSLPEEQNTPDLDMHFEAMKPMLDNATPEQVMEFIKNILNYKSE